MNIREFDALTFDCYGTLIDWETGITDHLGRWVQGAGVDIDREALLEAYAETEPPIERDHPTVPYREILRLVHESLSARFGIPLDATAASAFAESVGAWPAFPDSRSALEALGSHVKLVVVSNVDAISFAGTRDALGIDFHAVITAEEVGAYKPDLRVFHHALARLEDDGIERSRVLHVAQSLYHDHVPARRLGLRTAWVNRRRGVPGTGATPEPDADVVPDLEVGTLAELAQLLGTT